MLSVQAREAAVFTKVSVDDYWQVAFYGSGQLSSPDQSRNTETDKYN